jgi:YesN/AraC family two-component response regulator
MLTGMARILIIDDEEALVATLASGLQTLGHEVASARNGAEGSTRFEERRPDVVITDIMMPEKDGLEIISELCRRDPTVKIIAVSGGGSTGMDFLPIALQLGARRTLLKPFRLKTIAALIDDLMGAAPASSK